MSGLFMILVVIGIIVRIVSALNKASQSQHQKGKRRPPLTVSQRPTQLSTQKRTDTSAHASSKEQSAYEWVFGSESPATDPRERNTAVHHPDPEAHDDEDWMELVTPTVHMDLNDMHESRHDVVHESVHESLHVRHSRLDEAPAKEPSSHPFPMTRQTLSQALLLKEVLDPPRALRPWRSNKIR